MTAMQQLPKDSPIIKAWEKYKETDDYRNSAKWAEQPQHTEGSMWAAFLEGWNACLALAVPTRTTKVVEE